MEDWQQSLARSLHDPAILAVRFGLDPAAVAKVAARYPLRLTPHLLALIGRPADPLGRQLHPAPQEL
ncbi:MAG: lysine 2,3-aminomutase, partial [Desulfuromonas sp.]|nr:lysine 2,3-aminomutase [Desulfuromonas sp.]